MKPYWELCSLSWAVPKPAVREGLCPGCAQPSYAGRAACGWNPLCGFFRAYARGGGMKAHAAREAGLRPEGAAHLCCAEKKLFPLFLVREKRRS